MNDENKKLISQEELLDIMFDYIKPELDKCYSSGNLWTNGSEAGAFDWYLYNGVGTHGRAVGSRLYDDNHWIIYNDYYDEKNTNIKVFEDHVEFIEESKFTDFDKEFMRGLYLKIKEFVEGCDIKEDNNKMNNMKSFTILDVDKYVKNKLRTTAEGTSAYNVLMDIHDYIKHSMNIAYGEMNNGICNLNIKEVNNNENKLMKSLENDDE